MGGWYRGRFISFDRARLDGKTLGKDRLAQQLLAGGWLLGLLTETVQDHFQAGDDLDAGQIDSLIVERNAARDARDFTRADAIRDELTAMGIELEDTRDGTRWKISGD